MVARNWRCELGEIDLVVSTTDRDRPTVVFVEVKARRTDRFGPPAQAVGADKQRRLRRLAARWLADHRHGPTAGPSAPSISFDSRLEVRFDVVAVTGTRVEVIEAAF